MSEVLARRARRVAAVGVVAFGLLAPGAHAALSGPAPSFTTRPSLQSVTFNGLVASFNFDRAVDRGPAFGPGAFRIGGYRAGAVTPGVLNESATVSSSDPRSVLVTSPLSAPDFRAATFGAVAAGAVIGRDAPRQPVLGDAAPIRDATGQSGVRGHTAGPDLQAVAIDTENNRMTFTFDQDVLATGLKAASFAYLEVSGAVAAADAIVDVAGPSVTVAFDPPKYASGARQAIVTAGVRARDGARTPGPPAVSVGVPGASPVTGAPALVSVAQEAGSLAFLFTFDRPVGLVPAPDGLRAVLSNGDTLGAASTAVLAPATVRVTFPQEFGQVLEHVVAVSVAAGAVTGTSGLPVAPGGKPFGGNAGALASGFTTAPDPLTATVNRTTGQVSVLFDSRLSGAVPGNVTLLRADGAPVGGAAPSTATVLQSAGPSQARLVLGFTPAQADATAAIALGGNGVADGTFATAAAGATAIGTISGADAQNLRTIIVPGATTQTFTRVP